MISVSNLNFSYNHSKHEVLKDVNFEIKENETVGIIGANGAGKSTILKLLVGLELDYKGKIEVDKKEVNKKNLAEIRSKIGYVFQDAEAQIFMPTVYEDVAFAPRNYGLYKEEVEKQTMEALEKVGIENLKDRQIYRLSGGQKKLVSIATILSMKPEIVIFDEPTIALDPRNRRKFMEILNTLEGTKIVASHDLDLIKDTCKRTILINEGKIIKDGNTDEILTDKKLLEENGLELPLSIVT